MSLAAWWRRVTARDADDIPGSKPDQILPHIVIPPVPSRAVIAWGVPPECVELSHAFEGFRAAAYQCSAGVWTQGYGSTRDISGDPVTRDTRPVTDAQARDMAARDLERAAAHMAADFPNGLPPRWWAVGVLMSNNMGRMSVWGPSLMRFLHAGAWREAAAQMRHYRNADGQPSLGLRRRRWAEAAFALGMEPGEAKRRAWATIKTVGDWPPLP